MVTIYNLYMAEHIEEQEIEEPENVIEEQR